MNQDNYKNYDDLEASLRELADQSAENTDEILEEELKLLIESTATELEALRPMVTDQEEYGRLIEALSRSTEKKEKTEQLKERLTQSGGSLLKIGLSAARLLKGF